MPQFKPVRNLGLVVVTFLALLLLVDVGSVISSLFQIELLERMQLGDYTMQEADANDFRQMLIGVVWFLGFVTTAIVFIVWTHRAYKNVDALGGNRSMGPGWAIGAWFAPILNLIRPYQIVRESYTAAVLRDDPVATVNAPVWLTGWWILWVVNNIFGNIVFRLDEPEQISGYITNTKLYIASDVASMVAGVAAIVVVLKVSQAQTEAGERQPIENVQDVFA